MILTVWVVYIYQTKHLVPKSLPTPLYFFDRSWCWHPVRTGIGGFCTYFRYKSRMLTFVVPTIFCNPERVCSWKWGLQLRLWVSMLFSSLFCFLIPFDIVALLFPLPPSNRNSNLGSHSGLFTPLPTSVRALRFIAIRLEPFLPSSTRVHKSPTSY